MSGHGHVKPNPDGSRTRCGGPGICDVCSREAAREWSTMRAERDALRKQLEEADSLLRELHIRLRAFGRRSTECWELSEIESYIARHVGKRWTREGPAGLCTFCHGTGILPEREED